MRTVLPGVWDGGPHSSTQFGFTDGAQREKATLPYIPFLEKGAFGVAVAVPSLHGPISLH
jgi:hypothetical protein